MSTDRQSSGPYVNTGRFAGEAPRTVDHPEPSFFKLRLTKGGPFVPAKIWNGPPFDPLTGEILDRSWRLHVQVHDFRPTDDPIRVARVWNHGQTISEADYAFMRDAIAWARAHSPRDPMCNPFRPVNLSTLPPMTKES